MAKRTTKKTTKPVRPQLGDGVEILNAGSVLEDPITSTLETNYMPYAMSVIVSRALPEIDGFKPAHRKLLYTMYGMGLVKGARTKSANIVGSTMHLNPHGDAAIYDTMVRMGRGNESLLVPFVDSKGNFGKAYSRDMSCAAARYTEAKLEGVCEELFRDIDKETVDFVPNYDGTTTEPTLLPVTFPTILANNTLGIAVGMACNICSFNLAELCATTVALMKDPKHDISTSMPAPDFVGGGQILYDEAQMREVYENGRGSIKVRARYNVVPGENMLEITQIPPTTTVEAIMDKIAELVKAGKIKEISDMRDETDLNGLKLTLDLKRGVDPEKLMPSSTRPPRWRTASAATSMCWCPVSPGSWVCGRSCRSGPLSGWSVSAAAPTTISTARKSGSTCSRALPPSCWISIRPSISSAPPKRRPRWCPT